MTAYASKALALALAFSMACCAALYVRLGAARNERDAAWSENRSKQERLKEYEYALQQLETRASLLDHALREWKAGQEAIAQKQERARIITRDTARRDPSLREQLALPLHPALRRGGGLLGEKRSPVSSNPGTGNDPDGAPAPHALSGMGR